MDIDQAKVIVGPAFFPHLIGDAFLHGLSLTFSMSMIMSLVAAVVSFFRGKKYVYGNEMNSKEEY